MDAQPRSLLQLQGRDAEIVWRLSHGLDGQIEAAQRRVATVQGLLDAVGPWILQEIGARGLGLLLTETAVLAETIDPAWVATVGGKADRGQIQPQGFGVSSGVSSGVPQGDRAAGADASLFFVGDDRQALENHLHQLLQTAPPSPGHLPEPIAPPAPSLDPIPAPLPDVGQGDTLHLVAVPLEVHDETIGILAASFETLPPSPGAAVLLTVAGEELNNLFYEFRRARIRHRQLLQVGRLLQNRVLDKALEDAMAYLLSHAALSALILAYHEDSDQETRLCIRTYRLDRPCSETFQGDDTPLGQLFARSQIPSLAELLAVADVEGYGIDPVPLKSLLYSQPDQSLLCGVTPTLSNLTTTQELLEQFANALNQRLMDYHKDRRYLQTFFAPAHVSRLLSVGDYYPYLVPQLQDVAMLYTDINSFTKISEQVLDTPQEVGELIDYWSAGAVKIIHDHWGVFDKMVGDCIIGLFGPPFNEMRAVEKVAAAVEAALKINAYTRDLMGPYVVEKVRQSSLISGLGVATGIHYGSVMVGQFGPNHDFTAFGREMNSTARLQGVAGFREILVMEAAYGMLAMANHPLVREVVWSDRREAVVKNVRDPLSYRSIGV